MSGLYIQIDTTGATGLVVAQPADSGVHYYPFQPAGTDANTGVSIINGKIDRVIFKDTWYPNAVSSTPGNGDFNGGKVAIGIIGLKGFSPLWSN